MMGLRAPTGALCPQRSCFVRMPARQLACRDSKDAKDGKGSEQGKADFSAYWSLKIKVGGVRRLLAWAMQPMSGCMH